MPKFHTKRLPKYGNTKMTRIRDCNQRPLEEISFRRGFLEKKWKNLQARVKSTLGRTKMRVINQKPWKKNIKLRKKKPVRSFIVEEFMKNFEILKKNRF